MIRKLQRKFIMITMTAITLVMIVLVGGINMINFYQIDRKVDGVLNLLIRNDGKFPDFDKNNTNATKVNYWMNFEMTEETQYETRYFVVKSDREGDFLMVDTSHIAAVTEIEAQDYITRILDRTKTGGYIGNYKYLTQERPYGFLTVFVDCRSQIQTVTLYIVISFAIVVTCLLLVFIFIMVFSKRAVRPIIESLEKQKRFITDAGHEIKTPLAIISADADVLELSQGSNEWLESIRNQTARLDQLVKNLLSLSKMDEENIQLTFLDFYISNAVMEAAAPFAAVAETQGKTFELHIEEGLVINGDETGIRQLVSILVDNGVKYAQEGGEIKVYLKQSGKSVKLEVYNTGDELPRENLDKLFDRFYRTDSSRSRDTGGYGIGLSIAKNIVRAHKGKIFAKNENGKAIWFTAILYP